MTNHRRNASQRSWAGNELKRLRKVKRRRNAVPRSKQAQRELAAEASTAHPITRIAAKPR